MEDSCKGCTSLCEMRIYEAYRHHCPCSKCLIKIKCNKICHELIEHDKFFYNDYFPSFPNE